MEEGEKKDNRSKLISNTNQLYSLNSRQNQCSKVTGVKRPIKWGPKGLKYAVCNQIRIRAIGPEPSVTKVSKRTF